MAGISSRAGGSLDNDIKFNGKELNEDLDLDWFEYGFRNNFDPQLGRFHSVDPLASDYPYYTPFQFAGNQPTIAVDVDGLEPAFINDIMQWAAKKVTTDPNSNTSKTIGAVVGVGKSIEKTIAGVGNTIAHPIETGKALLNMNTPEGIANMAIGVAGKVNTLQNGTGFEKATVISEAVTDVATVVVGTKGLGAGVKGAGAVEITNATKTAGQLGREGMAAAGIEQNTTRIPSLTGTAKYRVPDGLTNTTLSEVKNVSKQSLTNQIRDYLQYSQQQGLNFELHVRPSTQLTKPLQQQVTLGNITLKLLPVL